MIYGLFLESEILNLSHARQFRFTETILVFRLENAGN